LFICLVNVKISIKLNIQKPLDVQYVMQLCTYIIPRDPKDFFGFSQLAICSVSIFVFDLCESQKYKTCSVPRLS